WGFEQVNFRKVNAAIDQSLQMTLGIDRPERIGYFQQALVVDLRDHPIEPTLGGYAGLHVSEGTPVAGSACPYVSRPPGVRGYVPLLGGAVLAARLRYGRIFGDVPPTERFFLGGASSQRGFGERRLAPFVSEVGSTRSVPYGGSELVDTSVEARVPITTIRNMPVGVAMFVDGGDVTTAPNTIDWGNLHWAVGAGLRVKTVVGPARLDVGYRL